MRPLREDNPAKPDIAGPLRAMCQSYDDPAAPPWSRLPFSVRQKDTWWDGARSLTGGLMVRSDRPNYELRLPPTERWLPAFFQFLPDETFQGQGESLLDFLDEARSLRRSRVAVLDEDQIYPELYFDPYLLTRACGLLRPDDEVVIELSLEGAGRMLLRVDRPDLSWFALVTGLRPADLDREARQGWMPREDFPLLMLRD